MSSKDRVWIVMAILVSGILGATLSHTFLPTPSSACTSPGLDGNQHVTTTRLKANVVELRNLKDELVGEAGAGPSGSGVYYRAADSNAAPSVGMYASANDASLAVQVGNAKCALLMDADGTPKLWATDIDGKTYGVLIVEKGKDGNPTLILTDHNGKAVWRTR